MKVLFIWAVVKGIKPDNLLPLGIGYLAANLPKTIKIKVWDGILTQSPNQKIITTIKKFKPNVIGFSVWGFNFKVVRKMTRLIKKTFPSLIIAVGGPTVSGYLKQTLKLIQADYGFAGEGEKSFAQFIDLLSQKKLTFKNKKKIPGLIFKNHQNKIIANPPAWGSLANLNHCNYEFINLKKYLSKGYRYSYSFHPKRTRIAPILTTRGCPFFCRYCTARLINGCKVRTRPVNSVIDEIKYLYKKYKITGFNIIDDNFTFNMKYAKKVCRKIIKLNLKNVSFNCPNGVKIEYLDKELLNLMKKVGWRYIFISPESGSKSTLKKMGKIIKLTQVEKKIRMIKKSGLQVFGYFIIGYPGETIVDIKKTINFAKLNDFDAAVFSCFIPLPGAPVYSQLLSSGEITKAHPDTDFFNVTYAPKGLTVTQLKIWRLWAMLRFYTSSVKRFKTALTLYSPSHLLSFIGKIIP